MYHGKKVKAVRLFSHFCFGCAHCGRHTGKIEAIYPDTVVWLCSSSDCQKITCILPENVNKSSVAFIDRSGQRFFPALEPHPHYAEGPNPNISYSEIKPALVEFAFLMIATGE